MRKEMFNHEINILRDTYRRLLRRQAKTNLIKLNKKTHPADLATLFRYFSKSEKNWLGAYMDQGLKEARMIIGQGSDFEITWVEDITALSEIENLLMGIISVSGDLSKEVLLATLDPKVHYCLERCDSSIQSVGELIENFTFLDANKFVKIVSVYNFGSKPIINFFLFFFSISEGLIL